MELLPKDILIKIALELDLNDILSLSMSSKRINEKVWNNNNFWFSMIRRDYNPGFNMYDAKTIYNNYFNVNNTWKKQIQVMVDLLSDQFDGDYEYIFCNHCKDINILHESTEIFLIKGWIECIYCQHEYLCKDCKKRKTGWNIEHEFCKECDSNYISK